MKLQRLISIIMILLERDKVSSSQLAEMFEVTPRTIFRDIDSINQAGIPIVTYPGANGGIAIMKQYKIEKKLFTFSDITALLKGLESVHTTMIDQEILNATAKIKGLIPEEQVHEIELKSSQIIMDHTPWLCNQKIKLYLQDIKKALNEQRVLSFVYSDEYGTKDRQKIEPYRLVHKENNWYLHGYCYAKEDFCIFQLSRITELQFEVDTYTPRKFDAPPIRRSEHNIITLKLLINASLLDQMLELYGKNNVEPYGNEQFIVQFPFSESEFGYNMLLQMGNQCECLEPPHVRTELIRRIKAMLCIYEPVT